MPPEPICIQALISITTYTEGEEDGRLYQMFLYIYLPLITQMIDEMQINQEAEEQFLNHCYWTEILNQHYIK